MLSSQKSLIQAFLLSATIVCCQLGTLVHAQADRSILGTQKSESGIRHSFLVTGSITAIIGVYGERVSKRDGIDSGICWNRFVVVRDRVDR